MRRPTGLTITAAAASALVAASTLSVPATADPPVASTTAIVWDGVAVQAMAAAGLPAPDGFALFGYVGIAVYDAAMAVDRTHKPFAVDVRAAARASAEAAVATAAHDVLVHFLPATAGSVLDPALAATLAGVPDGPSEAAGVAVGTEVARRLLAQRSGDGFLAPTTPPPVTYEPGTWVPTAATPPLGMSLAHMRPFSLKSDDQLRPAGPPELTSDTWARDFQEVQAVGTAASSTRTASQTLVARFWGEPPLGQAHASLRLFVQQRGLDLFDAARFLAMAEVSQADAIIACFDAKYHYRFWRPVTAIRAGDSDGNSATVGDPTWTPLLPTPNHPEYPSAHSCITPAVGMAAARFLDTQQIDYTVVSVTGLGNRTFSTPKVLADDVANGRVWAGIHFRSAVQDGATISKRAANWVLAHHFQELDVS